MARISPVFLNFLDKWSGGDVYTRGQSPRGRPESSQAPLQPVLCGLHHYMFRSVKSEHVMLGRVCLERGHGGWPLSRGRQATNEMRRSPLISVQSSDDDHVFTSCVVLVSNLVGINLNILFLGSKRQPCCIGLSLSNIFLSEFLHTVIIGTIMHEFISEKKGITMRRCPELTTTSCNPGWPESPFCTPK